MTVIDPVPLLTDAPDTSVEGQGRRGTSPLLIEPVDGLPLMHVEHPQLRGTRRLVKEVFDRVSALLGLLLIAPVLPKGGETRIASAGPSSVM